MHLVVARAPGIKCVLTTLGLGGALFVFLIERCSSYTTYNKVGTLGKTQWMSWAAQKE